MRHPILPTRRVSVYLTNSLEEHHPDTGTLFAQWLSKEANAASRIKKDIPIMVALGNPPYSRISSNMDSWVAKTKIEEYKYVDGVHINERKHWLYDDYVQFIRLGEYYIEKNGEGVLAYITNHGYLDNPTFRGMRWHLLNTFDDLYILDLHGNAKKKETAPDGSPDKNVFDIQLGVAIIIAIKRQHKAKSKPLAKVHHADLWGTRELKYDALLLDSLNTTHYTPVTPREPLYLFVQKNFAHEAEYNLGFELKTLFPIMSTGVQTSRDQLAVAFSKSELKHRIKEILSSETDATILEKYGVKEYNFWNLKNAKAIIAKEDTDKIIRKFAYRPFDIRYVYYSDSLVHRTKKKVIKHLHKDNVALLIPRQLAKLPYHHVFCTSEIPEMCVVSSDTKEQNNVCPLWVYENVFDGMEPKRANLDPRIYAAIKKIVSDVQPQSLFDYIYAVLHSRAYRGRYPEFLKSDFPRIPYPKDKKTFHVLAAKGAELRGLHLMESPALDDLITAYPVNGNHEVAALRWEPTKGKSNLGRVWINPTQYFDKVPLVAWEFHIGGYQPAQKWLKDRKGRKLSSDDLLHWQRIIVALAETDRVMSRIDKIDFLPK